MNRFSLIPVVLTASMLLAFVLSNNPVIVELYKLLGLM